MNRSGFCREPLLKRPTEGGTIINPNIDITFDFRSVTPSGRDPDTFSPMLRSYHKRLWGRTLPSGQKFDFGDSGPASQRYLLHNSHLGDFNLSCDSVLPTYTRWRRMQPIVTQLPEGENPAFRAIGYTIGGMMLWPRGTRHGRPSINVERGFNGKIADRMDLTLECIRRFYLDAASPMTRVLTANEDFFGLFKDFKEFVVHFLLQDLVARDFSSVMFLMPFDDFAGRPIPGDLETYKAYRQRTIDFIAARNQRILHLAESLAGLAPEQGLFNSVK